MELPRHIADRIRAWVDATPKDGQHVDHEAARNGGLSLMGTIAATWLLRPDGSFWEVDDDFGRPPRLLSPDQHLTALASGTERHPWLAELLPERPATALDCSTCSGRGRIGVGPQADGMLCPACGALGWVTPA